jgi:DNA-binding transcriptional ArsR family regulator
MSSKIIIDRPTLKAIAVDTRLDVLKSLGKRQKTLSELSKELNLSPATLKEHLDILLKVDLIKKNDSRKWKYYNLTYKGINLINPQETKALLSFVLGLILIIGFGFFLLGSFMSTSTVRMTASDSAEILTEMDDFGVMDTMTSERSVYDGRENLETPNVSVNTTIIYQVILFTLCFFTVYVGIFYFNKRSKRKKGD